MLNTEDEETAKKMFEMYKAEAVYFYTHGDKEKALRCYNVVSK